MQRNDLSRSLVAFDQTSTVVAVVELSLKNWLWSGLLPGVQLQLLPTIEQEDAKRPSREHESLVAESTRLVSRRKATLVRLGITGFNVKLRKGAERLAALRTLDGERVRDHPVLESGRCLERFGVI